MEHPVLFAQAECSNYYDRASVFNAFRHLLLSVEITIISQNRLTLLSPRLPQQPFSFYTQQLWLFCLSLTVKDGIIALRISVSIIFFLCRICLLPAGKHGSLPVGDKKDV